MEKNIPTLSALEEEAEAFVQTLVPGTTATLVTLSGELGAGKTTFTQAMARALGITETVTSPTFVLEKIYGLPESMAFTHLVHIDAYRLHKGEELHALGFDGLMQDPGNLVVLEWPERVQEALPPPRVSITLTPQTDGSRTLTYA